MLWKRKRGPGPRIVRASASESWTPPEGLREFAVKISEAVVPLLLEGEHPVLSTLRQQYRGAVVESVDLDGGGFFVNFSVPAELPAGKPPKC